MILVSRARPVRRTDNLTAIVSRLSGQCGVLNISTLQASTTCYGDDFTLFCFTIVMPSRAAGILRLDKILYEVLVSVPGPSNNVCNYWSTLPDKKTPGPISVTSSSPC
jgi:hypothetical protein